MFLTLEAWPSWGFERRSTVLSEASPRSGLDPSIPGLQHHVPPLLLQVISAKSCGILSALSQLNLHVNFWGPLHRPPFSRTLSYELQLLQQHRTASRSPHLGVITTLLGSHIPALPPAQEDAPGRKLDYQLRGSLCVYPCLPRIKVNLSVNFKCELVLQFQWIILCFTIIPQPQSSLEFGAWKKHRRLSQEEREGALLCQELCTRDRGWSLGPEFHPRPIS